MGILPWNMVFLSRSHFFLLDYMHIIIIPGTSLLSSLDLIVASLTLATKQRYRSSGLWDQRTKHFIWKKKSNSKHCEVWLIIKIEIQFIYLFILYVYYAWVSMCVCTHGHAQLSECVCGGQRSISGLSLITFIIIIIILYGGSLSKPRTFCFGYAGCPSNP